MNHQLLLEWVSERGGGSWAHLRDACAWLGSRGNDEESAWFAVQTLQSLAHIDLDWESQRWSAAPPVLTMLPGSGGYALVTGGRTRALVDALETMVAAHSGLYLKSVPQSDAPHALYVQCEKEEDIHDLASRVGIAYDAMVSDRLSHLLPAPSASVRDYPDGYPNRGFEVEAFDPAGLTWQTVESMGRPGLFRVNVYWRVQTWWSPRAGAYGQVSRAEGIYLELKRTGRHVLRWFPEPWNGSLVVPLRAPLPVLHARAATLCTGLAPMREERGVLRYMNVPLAVASRIAGTLGQVLAMEQKTAFPTPEPRTPARSVRR